MLVALFSLLLLEGREEERAYTEASTCDRAGKDEVGSLWITVSSTYTSILEGLPARVVKSALSYEVCESGYFAEEPGFKVGVGLEASSSRPQLVKDCCSNVQRNTRKIRRVRRVR